MKTLQEAKNDLALNWDKGIECPCCTQYVKLYRRSISGGSAYTLIRLYRETGVLKDFHLEDIMRALEIPHATRSDFSKLRFWGLIKPLTGKREDGSSRNGHWIVTNEGRDFIQGSAMVRKYAMVFNNKQYGYQGKELGIRETLTSKFNYDELMGYDV